MESMEKKGIFIAFEGLDGAGKTTCLNRLAKRLEQEGYEVLVTREPGGSPAAEKIRTVLLEEDLDGYSEALLFAAARNNHMKKRILPALEKGTVVLSDRFLFSSLAYQGSGRELGMEKVEEINDWFLEGYRPDLTLYLDAPENLLEQRRNARGFSNRLDEESQAFYHRIAQGFEALKPQMTIIDASKKEEEVAQEAYEAVRLLLDNMESENQA